MAKDFHIRQILTPSVSEAEYRQAEFQLYGEVAERFKNHLPIKWRDSGLQILEQSTCFKEWFLKVVAVNNLHLTAILESRTFPPQSIYQWRQWQMFYFEETPFSPSEMVLQAAVNEWLYRVSQQQETAELQTAVLTLKQSDTIEI